MSVVKKIFMTGEAGHHNLGDEGMALASYDRLREYFPKATIVATGLDPLGSVLRHETRVVSWPLLPHDLQTTYAKRLTQKIARKLGASQDFLDPAGRDFDKIFEDQYRSNQVFREALAELESADFVFDMGHGALNDVFNPFMLCIVYYMAKRSGKPLFISGQTVGPIWRTQSKRMLWDTLNFAHTLGLRDEGVSRQVLTEAIGLRPSDTRIVEVGDDTLDLRPIEPNMQKFTEGVRRLVGGQEFFAVQWRMSDYTSTVTQTRELVPFSNVVRLLCQKTGLIPLFVPLSWEVGRSDILAAARMMDLLQDDIPFHVAWPYLRAAEVKWLLGRAQFGVGISYHFHVFLLSQGVPSMAFFSNRYYEYKLRGVFAAYDYKGEPFHYPFENLQSDRFRQSVDLLSNWTHEDSSVMKKKAALLSARWHAAFQRFASDSQLRTGDV